MGFKPEQESPCNNIMEPVSSLRPGREKMMVLVFLRFLSSHGDSFLLTGLGNAQQFIKK